MRTKPMQLSVMAVAVLAVFAVAAVMLLSGGNPAQATTAATLAPDSGAYVAPEQGGGDTPGGGDNPPGGGDNPPGGGDTPGGGEPTPTPTPTPVQGTPEPCSPTPNHVMNSGHLAMFEAYWDADEETLVNNPCPPTLRHIPPTPPATEETHERTATGANIGSTIFHVSSDYKGTLVAATDEDGNPVATNEGAKRWSLRDYPFLGEGGSAGDPIWVMTECPEDRAPAAGQLCLGFSAGLLHPYYWDGDLQYEFEFEDEPESISVPDRGDVFVFYPHDEAPESERGKATWKTTNADTNELLVTPGDYTHRMWAFTEPGTYRLQVHAKGRPTTALQSQMTRTDRNDLETITSEVSTYTLHVGLLADLGVEVEAPDTAVNPNQDVTIEITANNGDAEEHDTATNTKVDISLPDGLTYKSHAPATATYTRGDDGAPDVWTVGDLEPGDVRILTITATVAAGTRGTEQKAKATIYATESFGTSEVVELDPFLDNNMAMDTVTVSSVPNSSAIFRVTRSVPELSETGYTVGSPVAAYDADGDTLKYWLTGTGHENFVVDGSGQITVSMCGDLDHETTPSYDLKLNASDMKDADSNPDPSMNAEHYIGVHVQVTDTREYTNTTQIAVQQSPGLGALSLGQTVTFTAVPENFPVCQELTYVWERSAAFTGPWTEVQRSTDTTYSDSHSTAGTWYYRVTTTYLDKAGNSRNLPAAIYETVTWR